MKRSFNKGSGPRPFTTATARAYLRLFAGANLNVALRLLLMATVLAVALYVILFSTTPAVHDFFHELRHSLMIVPCH